ncbi:MAG: peptide/nickel transport system substrate-binding protein, partial [Blastocatellia bacterium]|nr:peptide/nickel transport system substrate-binding protein [Blastocatellia bacterium]
KLADGTVSYDAKVVTPELAERWDISPDGKVYTFYLRKNASFHDGTPVNAKDVKWSFDRAVAAGGFPAVQMAAGSLDGSGANRGSEWVRVAGLRELMTDD